PAGTFSPRAGRRRPAAMPTLLSSPRSRGEDAGRQVRGSARQTIQETRTMLDWSEPKTATPASFIPKTPADATGLGEIDRGAARVSVDDKRMINARADV